MKIVAVNKYNITSYVVASRGNFRQSNNFMRSCLVLVSSAARDCDHRMVLHPGFVEALLEITTMEEKTYKIAVVRKFDVLWPQTESLRRQTHNRLKDAPAHVMLLVKTNMGNSRPVDGEICVYPVCAIIGPCVLQPIPDTNAKMIKLCRDVLQKDTCARIATGLFPWWVPGDSLYTSYVLR